MSWISSAIGAFTGSNKTKATNQAVTAQNTADQNAINLEQNQLNTTDANLQPFITEGQNAVGAQGDLLGLNGDPAQQTAITSLTNSPLYQSLYHNGEQAVLANGAATGGLRGGNEQLSLANFGANTLAETIQQQLSNLGGLSGQGATTGTNLGNTAATTTAQIGNQTVNQGANTAGGILGDASTTDSAWSKLASFLGGQNIGGLTQGGTTGGASGGSGFNLASFLSSLTGGNAGGQGAAQLDPDLAGLF